MKKKIIRFIKDILAGPEIRKWKPIKEWEKDAHGLSEYERESYRFHTSYRNPRWFWSTLFGAANRLRKEYNVEHLWFPLSIILHACDACYIGNGKRSCFEAWVPTNKNWWVWMNLSERFYGWVLSEDEDEFAE